MKLTYKSYSYRQQQERPAGVKMKLAAFPAKAGGTPQLGSHS